MGIHHAHRRDSSLRRLSIINSWLLAASVTLTAILTDVTAHAFPSKTSSHKSVGSTKRHSTRHHRSGRSAKPAPSSAPKSLNPPAEAPQAAPESPTATKPTPSEEPTVAPAPEQSAPASEAAPPRPEPTPAREASPVEETPAPVVSGGS
jgi:hypothetical protein